MACDCCSVTQRKLWVFGCGSVFVLLAIILGVLWPSLSLKLLHSQLILEKGSVNYDNWIETPIPMYLEVNMFNWTNPHEINDVTKKPHFEEIGPFIFREKHYRGVIAWNKNSTVTFNQKRVWVFDEKKSNHSLDIPITSANVITATVINMMKDEGTAIKRVIDYILNHKNGSLTWTKPAREWIFDGFKDPLLDFLHTLNTSAVKIPFKNFGWLVERNNSWTYDGIFTIKTGQDDIFDLGRQTLWNGANATTHYDGTCAMVNGTTGELWPPSIDTSKKITIFATDICRSVSLVPYNKTVTRFGVEGNVWGTDDRCFDNGEKYPEMKCFCPRKKKRSELFVSNNKKQNITEKPEPIDKDDGVAVACPDYGVVDISECRYGAPVYVSFPHFYMAHNKYLEKIDGLKPDKDKHNFTLTMNSKTGIPLEVNARLQINMLMQEATGFKVYNDVKHTFIMPMFWFVQKAELDEEIAHKAKLAISLPDIGVYTAYGIGAVGLIILIVGIVLCVTKSWKRNSQDSETLITN